MWSLPIVEGEPARESALALLGASVDCPVGPAGEHCADEALGFAVGPWPVGLHQHTDAGDIAGFALSYLGQDDDRLPWRPPALPAREDVREYPTDFSPMDAGDIDRIALRGELLTRLHVAYYLPEI